MSKVLDRKLLKFAIIHSAVISFVR